MDSSVLTLEDSDIINVLEDVQVVEERYKDSSAFTLTKEQALIELTNLLYEHYKHNVQSHVATYQDMFRTPKNTTDMLSFVQSLVQPIVSYKKIEYYDDPEFEPDTQVETEQEVRFVEFEAFLNQLNTLLKSRDTYTATESRLNKLFTPFEDVGATMPAEGDVDAYRMVGDVIQSHPFRLRKGDPVRSKAFLCKPHTEDPNMNTFDWQEYVHNIGELNVGDTVAIIFNDFFFHAKKPLYSIAAKVERIQGDTLHLKANNGLAFKYDTAIFPTNMYVYPSKSKSYRYAKADLLNRNVLFKNCELTNILPQTATEILHIVVYTIKNDIHSFADLGMALGKLGVYNVELHKAVQESLRGLFDRNLPRLVTSRPPVFQPSSLVSPYLSNIEHSAEGHFADNDLQRYSVIKEKLEHEQSYLLLKLKEFLNTQKLDAKRLYEQHSQLANKHTSKPKVDASSCPQPSKTIRIAKTYTTSQDLLQDQGKVIYYDKQHDTTNYTVDADTLKAKLVNDPSKTPAEINFEIKTLAKGKRKVREGDHCILAPDTLYVRKNVDGSLMWVKVRRFPFAICSESLGTNADESMACVYDVYDNICKTIDKLKENLQFQKDTQKADVLKGLIDFASKKEQFLRLLEQDLQMLKERNDIHQHLIPHMNIEKLPSVDLDDYYTMTDQNPDQNMTMQTFEDKDRYAVLMPDQKAPPQITVNSPAKDIIDMFAGFMDIEIRPNDMLFMINNINDRITSVDAMQAKLDKEKRKLDKSVDKALYASNDKYKAKVDKLVADKLELAQQKLFTDMYYDVCVNAISMLSLVIMMKYPKILIQSIYPSCVRFLSYQGYPINEADATRSLTKYLCCLLKGITSGSEANFDKVQAARMEDINKDVLSVIEEICAKDANIKLRVQSNAAAIRDSTKAHTTRDKNVLSSFRGFLPNNEYDDNRRMHDPVASRLRKMNQVIKAAKHLKISVSRLPQLLNACCLEKVSEFQSYYDYFQEQLPAITNTRDIKPSDNKFMFPPTTKNTKLVSDLFNTPITFVDIKHAVVHRISDDSLDGKHKARAFITANPMFATDDIMHAIDERYDDVTYWDEVVYGKTIDEFQVLTTFIQQAYDGSQRPKLQLLESMLIMMRDVKDIDAVRFVLHAHISTALPRYLQKIKASKFESEESWEMALAQHTSKWPTLIQQGLQNSHSLLYFEDDATKNVSLLMYVYVKFLYNLLLNTISDGPTVIHNTINDTALTLALLNGSDATKQKIALMARLTHDCILMLVDTVIVNDIDVGQVRKKVEELREQRKQDLIALYRVDDEERQLQMTLKMMGVPTWMDVGVEGVTIDLLQTEPQQLSVSEHRNKLQEAENYNLRDYKGENADDNGDEAFEDYPSQFIFSENRDV